MDRPSGVPRGASPESPVVSLSRTGLNQVAKADNFTPGVLNKRGEALPIGGKGVHSNRTGAGWGRLRSRPQQPQTTYEH